MTIPVYINQEQASELRVSQDGLYTVLELEISGITDRLVRLWAHGNGKTAYLGVMQPWSGGLYLRRKLSRRELAAFPDPIGFVSDREQSGGEALEANESKHNTVDIKNETRQGEDGTAHQAEDDDNGETENSKNGHKKVDINYIEKKQKRETQENEPDAEEEQAESLHKTNSTLPEEEESAQTQTDTRSCPWPAEPPEEGLLWYRRSDGSLTAFDGISSLLAIPAELRTKTPQMVERVIEGKKYLVFRT